LPRRKLLLIEVKRTVTILVTGWQQDAASTFDFIAAFCRLRHLVLAMTNI